MLRAEHLCKTFTTKRRRGFFHAEKLKVEAVRDVSLSVPRGKIVGLLGLNGAGKTTTIKMLTTLLEPTAGTYTLDGTDAVASPRSVKQHVNMVAGGERMIYWRLTARENLAYFGRLYGIESQLLRERSEALLALVGLAGKEDIPVETFSKGMKQRLQIARGLINDPAYLFMDEPTIGLDAVVARELRQHVLRLARQENKGILLTSHYMGEIEELCDYIYILDKGRVLCEGTAQQLTKEIFGRRSYVLRVRADARRVCGPMRSALCAQDAQAAVEARGGEIYVTCKQDLSLAISRFCTQQGLALYELHEQAPSLEDAVIRLAKEGA